MEIITKNNQISNISIKLKEEGKSIGFVPTMGYLHQGHINLIRSSKKECSETILSIFVNPTQFGPTEDFKRYPRNFERDCKIAEQEGVGYLFYPSTSQMYKKNHSTFVRVLKMEDVLCGKNRKDHFVGVCTVVIKLFNIIMPDVSYFGMKDYQQLIIIKKMVEDLNLKVFIRPVETARDNDGLALSSRNKYLSPMERKNATVLYKTLEKAKSMLLSGESDLLKIKSQCVEVLQKNEYVKKVEYFDIRNGDNLNNLKKIKKDQKILVASAVLVGKTRLIDNIVFNI